MDRYPSVFGSEQEQIAEVLREIVRKRDNDVSQFNGINTQSIQALSALTPAADKVPYFDGTSSASLMDIEEFQNVIVKTSYAETATHSNTTSAIPLDDTLPQSSEGVSVLSLTHSAETTTNKLRIRAVIPVGFNATTTVAIGALFVGTGTVGANAVAASAATGATTSALQNITLVHEYVPGTTSSQTIEVRAGTDGAGGIGINGTSATRLFGGVAKATITVEEIRA